MPKREWWRGRPLTEAEIDKFCTAVMRARNRRPEAIARFPPITVTLVSQPQERIIVQVKK